MVEDCSIQRTDITNTLGLGNLDNIDNLNSGPSQESAKFLAQSSLPHSTLESHSNILVLSRNQFEHINNKLDQLTKRVHSLEQNLATDVRVILNLLQASKTTKDTSCSRQEVKFKLHSLQKLRQYYFRYQNMKIYLEIHLKPNIFFKDL